MLKRRAQREGKWSRGGEQEAGRRERERQKKERGDEAEGTEQMAAEETAGGARKATKSKLFEFLVHGVVSGAVLSFL